MRSLVGREERTCYDGDLASQKATTVCIANVS